MLRLGQGLGLPTCLWYRGASIDSTLLCVPLLLQIDQNCMAGVLSMKDVVKVLLDDQKHEIDSLKDYIHGSW